MIYIVMYEPVRVDDEAKPTLSSRALRSKESLADFWSECQATWIDKSDALTSRPFWKCSEGILKSFALALVRAIPCFRRWLNARGARINSWCPGFPLLGERMRGWTIRLGKGIAKAASDVTWAKVPVLTVLLMTLICSLDILLGQPVAFRLLYLLPLWLAARLGTPATAFSAMIIVGLFSTVGDQAFEAQDATTVNFVVRWLALGGFLLLALHVEGALKLARQQATRDPLTGLPNRYTIESQTEQALANAPRDELIHLALIDCDNFKDINDQNGHAFGDHALKMLGRKLESAARGIGIVGRLGGDEFIVLFRGVELDRAHKALEDANAGFERILQSFSSTGGMSFGIATRGKDGHTFARLCRIADERMYAKKRVHASHLAVVKVPQFSDGEPLALNRGPAATL